MGFQLTLPKRDGTSGTEELEIEGNSIVITGANGSGKTRLGIWIEESSSQRGRIHRIAAQRMLAIPTSSINLLPYERAENYLMFGSQASEIRESLVRNRRSRRWSNNPETQTLNDFVPALTLLFAKKNERNFEFAEHYKLAPHHELSLQQSPDETIEAVWGKIFPYCRVNFDFRKGEVTAIRDNAEYHSSTMSDGERSALYWMAQVLCVPPDTILVIDEPEIHLHRAIFTRLWNQLENLRADCKFVYITHDLEFASSRTSAKKLWVKDYSHNPQAWKWEELTESPLPDDLRLKVLGSRHNVIFVEGTSSSLDFNLYQKIFSDHLVIPCGGSEKVIENTKAFRDMRGLHNLEINGIIDRDYRPDSELEKLAQDGIYALKVAEVENLYCIPEIIGAVANWNQNGNPNGINSSIALQSAEDKIWELLEANMSKQVIRRTEYLVAYHMHQLFGGGHQSYDALASTVDSLSENINHKAIYDVNEDLYKNAILERNYDVGLKLYNEKDFIAEIARCCGLSKKFYITTANNLLGEDKISKALKRYFPSELIERTKSFPQ